MDMNFNLSSRRNLSRVFATTVAGLGILALAACGQTSHDAAGPQAGKVKQANDSHVTNPDDPGAVPGDTPSAVPTDDGATPVPQQPRTGNDSGVQNPSNPNTIHQCASRGLSVRIAPYNGAAGHLISRMTFTNTSGATCYMRGYPGVSYVAGDDGHQVGGSAIRQAGNGVQTVRMAPGGHAYAMIDQADIYNYSSASCRPASVRGYRVYPPNQTAAKYVPSPDQECANRSVGRPKISPLRADPNGL